jgi:hypothetical protein
MGCLLALLALISPRLVLFLLSTYLGHAKVSDTYWYLTGVPELLAIAGQRFERFDGEQGLGS